MKKMLIMMAVVLLMGCFVVLSADAGDAWYTCDVTSVGAGGESVHLQVTDQGASFSNKWTIIQGSKAEVNQKLAIILTATQLGRPVYIYMDASANQPLVQFVCLFISGSLF